jgi:ribosomal protein S27AE
MTANRVVEGRMVTPETLAELIENDDVMDAEPIQDADRECPNCGGNVLEVGYMPSITEFVTGWKCQDCGWSDTDRE